MAKEALTLSVTAAATAVVGKAAELLRRTILERTGLPVCDASPAEARIVLGVERAWGPEAFAIREERSGAIHVTGGDERGLLYGVGQFLRSARGQPGEFRPGPWRGRSAPALPLRGMYFATHFFNFYHAAPIERVQRYVEELALWGFNALMIWLDMHHYRGIDDPACVAMIDRLRAIWATARSCGLGLCFAELGNEAYADSPIDLRADPNTGRAHYHVELCPNKPGAKELMLRWFEQRLDAFADLKPEYICLWPYDQGGCACEKCRPWGAGGFLDICRAKAGLARKKLPGVKIVLSTWLFDYPRDEGEWAGLARAFTPRPDWVDYVLAESHTDFPRYPLDHGVPGGLPMVNFPEISMFGMSPWGGYGANPLPDRCRRLWDVCGRYLAGGFPYSEGIYEDINKVIYSRLYWDPGWRPEQALREYAAYEFSPEVADDVLAAATILERNHSHTWDIGRDGPPEVPPSFTLAQPDAGSAEAYEKLARAERKLPDRARRSWRWRILLLRALIDRELYATGGRHSDAADAALTELTEIYCAQEAVPALRPPSRAAARRRRREKAG